LKINHLAPLEMLAFDDSSFFVFSCHRF
jgi:hypothetical protein